MKEKAWVDEWYASASLRSKIRYHWVGLMMKLQFYWDWILDRPYWYFPDEASFDGYLRTLRTKKRVKNQ